jgi:hypothetical protein
MGDGRRDEIGMSMIGENDEGDYCYKKPREPPCPHMIKISFRINKYDQF